MKSKDYEYMPSEEYDISDERKNELIKKVEDQVRKGFIAHYQILNIGKDDAELDFLYNWLDDNNIEIRGINGTISGEISNYTHIPKMGQSIAPDILDSEIQEESFEKLHSFSDEDKKDKKSEYHKMRKSLIEKNMKLAKWVTSWSGIAKIQIPIEDKYQMAYLGLVNAVDNFDPSKGYKFSTYACKVIYRKITREAYREDGETRQNMILNEQLAMIPKIKDQIFSRLEREAKTEEIADILGVSIGRIKELERLINLREKESLEQIEGDRKDIETVSNNLFDSDTIFEADDGYIMDGVYIDEEDILPLGFTKKDRVHDKSMVEFLKNDIRQVLSTITTREREVLIKRFGLDDGVTRTLDEVGKIYKLSGSRIRQIELKALMKLRHPTRAIKLKGYVDDVEDSREEDELIVI